MAASGAHISTLGIITTTIHTLWTQPLIWWSSTDWQSKSLRREPSGFSISDDKKKREWGRKKNEEEKRDFLSMSILSGRFLCFNNIGIFTQAIPCYAMNLLRLSHNPPNTIRMCVECIKHQCQIWISDPTPTVAPAPACSPCQWAGPGRESHLRERSSIARVTQESLLNEIHSSLWTMDR